MRKFFVLPLLFVSFMLARIIRIPADYPTIQQGLNAANYGDTVLVASGTYYENIIWPSVDGIQLDSETGATSTIIDGDTSASVIAIRSGITNSTLIYGFTIRNGKATTGAGIYLYDASPTIFNNIIRDNLTTGSSYSHGGGIYCYGISGSSPRIIGNHIIGNKVVGTNWNYGGGIFIGRNSTAIVGYNDIEQDSAIGGSWNYGAGIYCDTDARPFIYHNRIMENVGIQGSRSHGTGIYVNRQSYPVIFNNLIINNRANSGSWNYGAGIRVDSGGIIINNTIANNICTGGFWNYGGGIFLDGTYNYIYNNIIVSNQGGGIYNYDPIPTQLIDYNNVWNNSPTNYYNCSPGSNDRQRDPLFAAGMRGNYYLSHIRAGQLVQSPCVDSGGIVNDTLLAFIRTATTRTDSVPDSNNVDMGYHYPIGALVSIAQNINANLQKPNVKITVSPNPFRIKTNIGWQIAGTRQKDIKITIFDISGRVVKQFNHLSVSASIQPFNHVSWDGSDNAEMKLPQGIYFVQLKAGIHSVSEKAILLR